MYLLLFRGSGLGLLCLLFLAWILCKVFMVKSAKQTKNFKVAIKVNISSWYTSSITILNIILLLKKGIATTVEEYSFI